MPYAVHGSWLGSLSLVMVVLAIPACALLLQPQRLNEPLDRIFMAQSVAWLLAPLTVLVGLGKPSLVGALQAQWLWQALVYHAVLAVTVNFLLACAGLSRTVFGHWSAVYAVLGAVLFVMGLAGYLPLNVSTQALAQGWMALTLLTASAALLGVMLKLRADMAVKTALLAAACWWGWSLVVSDVAMYLVLPTQVRSLPTFELTAPHIIFCAYVVALWLLLTGRVGWMIEHHSAAAGAGLMHGVSDFASLSGADMPMEASLATIGQQQDFTASAVAEERRRIAQDIHDGVGSQLVGLLASLDASSPTHRRIMLGLESCLLDLKTTVDNVDSTDDSDTNIFDALGRMRYRFQPSLSRLGIQMQWKIDVSGPLIAVRPAQLAHVVRIVQECLANVLLHSEAKTVRVTCGYEDQGTPRMLLEVLDDGVGMAERSPQDIIGKGLSGMKERALAIGAQLQISTRLGLGTRVRLYLPLAVNS
jgi:signal transduction histidine kinase